MKALLVLVMVLCAGIGARAETQTFLTYDFEFEDGSVLPELRVAYETRGRLDGGRDNAILLLHGTSADRHAFDPMIGPGKTFDTNKYFVITADPIGGGAIQMIGGRRTLVRQALDAATPADLLTRVAGFTNDYIARTHADPDARQLAIVALLPTG